MKYGEAMNHGQDSRRYVLVEGIELYPAAGELIAVDKVRDEVHYLNGTATTILRACDGRTAEEILVQLSGEYPDVPREEIEADMASALTELEAKGLIRTFAPGEAPPRSGGE